jgi:hypothetical protein
VSLIYSDCKEACSLSTKEIGATCSATDGAGSQRDSIGRLAVMVDPGLSSLDTSDSMAVTCSPLLSHGTVTFIETIPIGNPITWLAVI